MDNIDAKIIWPFSPSVSKVKIPEILVDKLNLYIDDIVANEKKSEKLDSGKIIAKKKVKIFKKDTLKKLEKRVLKEENKLYPLVLEKLVRS